jgi:dihydrofolate reductase
VFCRSRLLQFVGVLVTHPGETAKTQRHRDHRDHREARPIFLNMIIGIVAVDKNGVIGKGGHLPWHYSSDMKHFKSTTLGNACVMGHNTWLTLKKPLKDRLNIVLSRKSEIASQDSVMVLRDLTSVLSLPAYLRCDLFVIGGEKIYKSFLPYIDRWIVTEVPIVVEDADAFVPKNYLEGFEKTDSKPLDEGLIVSYYDRK